MRIADEADRAITIAGSSKHERGRIFTPLSQSVPGAEDHGLEATPMHLGAVSQGRAQHRCATCEGKGHWESECPTSSRRSGSRSGRRMSRQELYERGLCFNCHEEGHTQYKCPNDPVSHESAIEESGSASAEDAGEDSDSD